MASVSLCWINSRSCATGDRTVEFLDGGTRGIVLLSYLENRKALLILDAIALGDAPGSVRVIEGYENFLTMASRPVRRTRAMPCSCCRVLTLSAWKPCALPWLESPPPSWKRISAFRRS